MAVARPAATSTTYTRRKANWQAGPDVVDFGKAQASDRTEQQHAGHSTAHRGFRQRDVYRRSLTQATANSSP